MNRFPAYCLLFIAALQVTLAEAPARKPSAADGATGPRLIIFDADAQLRRVRTELRAIDASLPGNPKEAALRKRALLQREILLKERELRSSNDQEKQINEQQNRAGESMAAKDAARERRKASRDNIQKFLDILRSMNPQI